MFLEPGFKSPITHKLVRVQVVSQEDDKLINAIRETAVGTISEETNTFLHSLHRRLEIAENSTCTHLFARNIDATIFNSGCLERLDTEESIYKANINSVNSKYLNKILATNYLHLKVSCPVILLVNLGGRLVNGIHGLVRVFNDDNVTVYFLQINESHNVYPKLHEL